MMALGSNRSPRRGNDLQIHIRIALSSLNRDTNIKLNHLSIADLESMLIGLRKEQRDLGLLKEKCS